MKQHTSCENPAPGGPGAPPRWTQGDKDAIGTAYSTSSRIWFTVSRGLVNEVYYPTVDRPQIRDLQFVVADGESFCVDERNMAVEVDPLAEYALDVRLTTKDREGRFRIEKEIISDPHEACLLVRTRFSPEESWQGKLKLFALCSPHLEMTGRGNNGYVIDVGGRRLLVANKGNTWMAMTSSVGLERCSWGYVGENDGWQDLSDNYRLDRTYSCAHDGNIAAIAEINPQENPEFTLALAFGHSQHNVITTLFQSLSIPFEEQAERYREQWQRACNTTEALQSQSRDGGLLYRRSQSVLLAHEDKSYPGAMIASLSIPWGQAKTDEEGLGGYHLVWTRDMVHSALGLLATENTLGPLRALIYLAVSQREDGGFYQNFWVNGEPFWQGTQLDEVAFPILLAWRLKQMGALKHFDPYPMVRRAAGFLIRRGPATPQERWEEASGYSPSTLASNIAALTCAATMIRERGDEETATFVQEYADFLESHVEAWTVTSEGTVHPEISRHYIRVTPADPDGPHPNENPNEGTLVIPNRHPGGQNEFPAREIVDAGFLELVRYGIRPAGTALMEDSLKVVDAALKVDTPAGPCWHRYNHDGYGQQADGSPFNGWGVGRAWPLLTGERAHYELAAGREVEPLIRALERFASNDGLLPEQIWDQEDTPEPWLALGGPTGSAMPLAWAHAEYIRLLRSAADGAPFDRIPEVADRYLNEAGRRELEVWKPNRQVRSIRAGQVLRIQQPAGFRLRLSTDGWDNAEEVAATNTGVGIAFVDLPTDEGEEQVIEFTFYYPAEDRWEGQNYRVEVAGA